LLRLAFGTVSDPVDVEGSATPIVETASPTLGQVVTNCEINNLPLVNRDTDGGRGHDRRDDR
jgi:hypothetical protein